MASPKRRTSRTDANGNLLDQYRGLYEYEALAAASDAGIPGHLLDRSGWDGRDDDITGFWSEQIYRVGEINWTAPDAIEQLGEVIELMRTICRNFGVDPKAAMAPVYDLARFKRQLHEVRARHASLRGEALPLADEAEVLPGW